MYFSGAWPGEGARWATVAPKTSPASPLMEWFTPNPCPVFYLGSVVVLERVGFFGSTCGFISLNNLRAQGLFKSGFIYHFRNDVLKG